MKWYRKAKTTSFMLKKADWKSEFGPEFDVPAEVLDLVRQGLADDISWHNDSAPVFGQEVMPETWVKLWVDHPDQDQRESEQSERFGLTISNPDGISEEVSAYNDVGTAIAAYKRAIQSIVGDQDETKPMSLEQVQGRMWDLSHKPRGMDDADRAEFADLKKRHSELHPEGHDLPKFLASRNPSRIRTQLRR